MPRCGKILVGRTQFWLCFFPTPSLIFRLNMGDFNTIYSQVFISNIFNAYFLVTETPWNFDQSRATSQDQRGLVGELSKCCLNCARLMVGWFTRVCIFKGCLISERYFQFGGLLNLRKYYFHLSPILKEINKLDGLNFSTLKVKSRGEWFRSFFF